MVKATVVGASGYMGGELLRILVRHPEIDELVAVSRKNAGKPVSSHHRNLYRIMDEPFQDLDLEDIDSDVTFFAAPQGEWFTYIPRLLNQGMKVITLGGKFRIQDPEVDMKFYGGYENSDLLAERIYGLPELYRDEIKKARFVTNPGCYATSVLLGLLPVAGFKDKVDLQKMVASCVSGTSGAGIAPSEFLHHPEAANTIKPYKLFSHRHVPEIEFILKEALGEDLSVLFTPSIANMSRGIMSYITLFSENLGSELYAAYDDFYSSEPFVRVVPGKERVPGLLNVVNTNFCDIGVNLEKESGRVLVLSTLDNLIKGGSGQAVQNMNLMLGFKETMGLGLVGGHP